MPDIIGARKTFPSPIDNNLPVSVQQRQEEEEEEKTSCPNVAAPSLTYRQSLQKCRRG